MLINNSKITLLLTPRIQAPKYTIRVGETRANFDMKGFNLSGKTDKNNKGLITEGLLACTGGVFMGKLLNIFHENSSIYDDAQGTRKKVYDSITKKIIDISNSTKENIQAFLFGGWGYGSDKNTEEVTKSHNLFNNIALCIEDELPEKFGIEVPLTTIWGKYDSSIPDAVYAKNDTIVLENNIFKLLFGKGKSKPDRNDLINFLNEHYEEVQIPENIDISAKENCII